MNCFRQIALLMSTLLACVSALAGSPKVLIYHHVSDETPASTSVSPATFEAHLDLIERAGYEVVPLARIVDGLVENTELDSRWVGITFDDAYRSIITTAAPMLSERGWPFTVFVSTNYVDDGNGIYLNWDELRKLETEGASIANHSRAHEHMVRKRSEETRQDWQARLARDVMAAQDRLEAELHGPLRMFAYPYGEFTADLAALMQSLGFISFGQQSGPIGATTSPYAIPRFPLAKGYDSVASLAEKLRTEHLPLLDPVIPASLLAADAGPPLLTMRISDSAGLQAGSLNCFVDGTPTAKIIWSEVVKVQADGPLPPGRSKYTCTAPHPDIPRAYYWHSHLYIKPRADGSWYDG